MKDVNANEYLPLLNDLENEMLKHEYEFDNRFVTYCRRDFLRKEFTDYLEGNTFSGRGKFNDAYVDLSEYFYGNTWISLGTVPEKLDFRNVIRQDDEYKNSGIICEQEKDILLDMIKEFKHHIKIDMEVENMGLFNKKKYEVNEKENIPQFVYGIPDDMRKKWEERDKNGKEVFSAFHGGYSGESYFFFVNKIENTYQFRFGYSSSGMLINNDINDPNLKCIDQDENHYNMFIEELESVVKDWKESYNNNNIMDGTQWHIDLVEKNKRYFGSNEFPKNYTQLQDVLNKYFNVEHFMISEEKYEMNPEDNVPREVYGIPDFIREKRKQEKYDIKPEDNVPQKVYGIPDSFTLPKVEKDSIRINIKKGNSNYVMLICHFKNNTSYELTFGDINNLEGKTISDISTNITESYYNSFVDRFNNIVKNWNSNYSGSSNVNWSIKLECDNKKIISGNGGFPENWNELIELLIEYEMLFKQKKVMDIEKIDNMKYDKLTFEELVREKFKDTFWADTIIKYFREDLKATDVVAKVCFKDLIKYDDILNEFTKCLIKKTYDFTDSIEINGYTAKKIHELNPSFSVSGVYTFLQFLRDDKEKAEDIIKKGFPNKDAISPVGHFQTEKIKCYNLDLKILKDTIDDLKNNPDSCSRVVGAETEDGSFKMFESSPGKQLREFITYFYNNNLIDYNYGENYKKIEDKQVADYSYEDVLTALSAIIRGDRFVSGQIYSCFKDGTLLKLVEKLMSFVTTNVDRQYKPQYKLKLVHTPLHGCYGTKEEMEKQKPIAKTGYYDLVIGKPMMLDGISLTIEEMFEDKIKINFPYQPGIIANHEQYRKHEATNIELKLNEKYVFHADVDDAMETWEITLIDADYIAKTDDLANKYLKEIKDEVDQEMIKRGLLTIDENGKELPVFGSCNIRWSIEKEILKERYNIDWQTPAERNPFIKYD